MLLLLLGASAVSWAIIAKKWLQIRRAQEQSARFLETFWQSKRLDAIYQAAERLGSSPISQVFRAGYVELSKVTAQKKEAAADYGSAIAVKPDVEYYMERGALQESLRDLDGAAAGYRDGFAQLGGAVTLRLALIRVETARKNYDTALALVDEIFIKL